MKYSICLLLTFITTAATAQPTISSYPEQILIRPDGTFELQLAKVRPQQFVPSAFANRVPVYTESPDGTLRPGQYFTNQDTIARVPQSQVAGNIILDNKGEWNIDEWSWRRSHGTVQPGSEVYIGLDTVGIDYIPDSSTQVARSDIPGPIEIPVILPSIDFTDKPSDLSAVEISVAVNRAVNVWENILKDNNFGPIPIEFFFDDSTDALAYAGTLDDDRR